MAPTPGERLGPYEILAPIGAGGMGEVYRARDTKLGREVAIKVLSEEFSRDADKLARFQREAHLLAALNHPNIVHVYSVEEADGVDFIAMELVKGKTLAELLPKRAAFATASASQGLALDKFLDIAIPLADAVASAHDTPVSICEVNPDLPSELAKIVRRCLAKDPDGRLQFAKDLRNELRELKHESGLTEGKGNRPRWSRDGKQLFYLVGARFADQDAGGNVWSLTLETVRSDPLRNWKASKAA